MQAIITPLHVWVLVLLSFGADLALVQTHSNSAGPQEGWWEESQLLSVAQG